MKCVPFVVVTFERSKELVLLMNLYQQSDFLNLQFFGTAQSSTSRFSSERSGHFRSSHMPSANSVAIRSCSSCFMMRIALEQTWPLLVLLLMMKVLELTMVGTGPEARGLFKYDEISFHHPTRTDTPASTRWNPIFKTMSCMRN